MISVIEGLPDNVIGIKATGVVTHEDYLNRVIPQVERTLAAHREFRILYEIGDDCEAFEVLALTAPVRTLATENIARFRRQWLTIAPKNLLH